MNIRKVCTTGLVSLFLAVPAMGGAHTWRWSEVFSTADGQVQFLELKCDASGENGVNGLQITVVVGGNTVSTFNIPNPSLPGSTANKKLLLATNGFASLPGAPARDYTIPANFFPTSGAFTIRYNPPGNYDTNVIAAGTLPTDGIKSLQYTSFLGANGVDTFVIETNNPTNYAGVSGPVNVPTVSEWGVLAMALLTLNAGSILIRKRI